jgi:hypothetical protein
MISLVGRVFYLVDWGLCGSRVMTPLEKEKEKLEASTAFTISIFSFLIFHSVSHAEWLGNTSYESASNLVWGQV